jgi:predicted TPR repeat methyltransferase
MTADKPTDKHEADTARSDLLRRAYAVDSPNEVRALYRDWARSYDDDLLGDDLQYVAPLEAVAVFRRHVDDTSARVLDVGCGTGLSGQALADAGFTRIDGADISPDMLERARAKGVYARLIEADLTAGLDIADDTYDAALSVGTFTHGHVGPDGLDEVIRVVRPGGIVCVTINEGVFEKMAYPAKIEALQRDGQARVLDLADADYLRGEGIRSKLLVLEVV